MRHKEAKQAHNKCIYKKETRWKKIASKSKELISESFHWWLF